MKAINQLRKRKGVSPVIATVILVAVTITVAVAVAYWMSGIAGQYTAFEKVEIQSGYAIDDFIDGWNVTIVLKNSGTAPSTIVSCFINDKIIGLGTPADLLDVTCEATTAAKTLPADEGIPIDSGKSDTLTIGVIPYAFSSSGTTINVKLHSAAGMDYIRLIKLP